MNFAQTTTIVVTESDGGLLALLGTMWLIWVAVVVLQIIAMWRIFEKAQEAGWKSLIPFYNTYLLFRIAGRNGWGFLLLLVPIVQIVVAVMVSIDLAKHFGKSTAFGVIGLFLFSFIGYLMLGFGDAKYLGPKHA